MKVRATGIKYRLTNEQQKLAEGCLRLAYHEAIRQWRRGHRQGELENYVSIAYEGLCYAAYNFESKMGNAFTSYATISIRRFFYREWFQSQLVKRKCPTRLIQGSALEPEEPSTPGEGEKDRGWWAGAAPEEPLEQSPDWLLQDLPFLERYILEEHYFREKKLKEIALALGMTKQRVH